MKNIPIRYGIILFLSLTSFFLFMYMIGQAERTWLRLFNGVIHLIILYFALSKYHEQDRHNSENYLNAVGIGMYTSIVGAVAFGLFIFFFLNNNDFLTLKLAEYLPVSNELIPLSAALFILVEGIVAGLIGSYILVRFIDR